MRILLVTLYWPPAGGAGVQRSLKHAAHLAELGHELTILAPDDPKWLHRDEQLEGPPGLRVRRVRNRGPRARRPAEERHAARGLARARLELELAARALLVPDASVIFSLAAARETVRLCREQLVDVVLTTSPPGSVHLAGAAGRRLTGVPWVADLRDSLLAHAHRRREIRGERTLARLVARYADAIVTASKAIGAETAQLHPRGRLAVIENGIDFDDFAGLPYRRESRFRITHTGSFFGRRDPRPFLQALARAPADVTARFVGDFRTADREFAESLGLGERLELVPYLPRQSALALQRDSDALLLLVPEAGGRGKGVLSGKVFEYLAAERPIIAAVPPDGEAAALVRRVGAGAVVAPDDVQGLTAAIEELVSRWRAGDLPDRVLAPAVREQLSRRRRVEQLAALLEQL